MKKFLMLDLTLLLSMTMVFGVSGCNVTTDPGDNGGEVPPEENPDATVFLEVGTLTGQFERNLMQEWINKFQQANKEVSITISRTFQGMSELIDMKNMGVLPDIVWTGGDQHSNYSGSGYFYDLSDETLFPGSAEFFSDFYPTLIETTHYSDDDDGIWFVPRDYNRLVVYINKTAFEALGIEIPSNNWTWEDFESICEQMSGQVRRPLEWRVWPPLYTTMLYNFGGRYFDENGQPALDSEQTEDCFNYLKDFLDKYTVTGNGGTFKSYNVDMVGSSVPMIIDVRPQLSEYMTAAYNGGWELEAVAFPNFVQEDGSAGYTAAGCSGYAITTECTDATEREWAWKFLQYCMSQQGYEDVGSLGNIVPALQSLANTGSWTEYTYGGMSVSYEAFMDTNTNDIFLNYYNSIDVGKHDSTKLEVSMFWDRVLTYSYSDAISTFNTNINDILS